jgi:hypothetical protein
MTLHIWITLVVTIVFGGGIVSYLMVNLLAPIRDDRTDRDGGQKSTPSFERPLPMPPEEVDWARGFIRRSRSLDPDNLQTESRIERQPSPKRDGDL